MLYRCCTASGSADSFFSRWKLNYVGIPILVQSANRGKGSTLSSCFIEVGICAEGYLHISMPGENLDLLDIETCFEETGDVGVPQYVRGELLRELRVYTGADCTSSARDAVDISRCIAGSIFPAEQCSV